MNNEAKEIILNKLKDLETSSFRSSFKLRKYMLDYIDKNGMTKIKEHAYSFIKEKIAVAEPKNDGKQTPMKNHPVFVAQHATATCCRNCLLKWHHIPKGRELTSTEVNYIVALIMTWIQKQYFDMGGKENG